MQNLLGLRYTTLLDKSHRQTHGDNEMSSSNVNVAFRKLKPKINKNQENTKKYKEWGKVEICGLSKSEAMVDHSQQTSRGEIVSAKFNEKK